VVIDRVRSRPQGCGFLIAAPCLPRMAFGDAEVGGVTGACMGVCVGCDQAIPTSDSGVLQNRLNVRCGSKLLIG
jgi:hypothetical protein